MKKGKIYKIINTVDDLLYIGSTKLSLNTRFICHKSNANRGKKAKLYIHMRTLGIVNFKIEIVKEIEYETIDELRAFEQAELLKHDQSKLLNMRYAKGQDKTKTSLAHYHKKMKDPVLREKERARDRKRYRKKRKLSSNNI